MQKAEREHTHKDCANAGPKPQEENRTEEQNQKLAPFSGVHGESSGATCAGRRVEESAGIQPGPNLAHLREAVGMHEL